MSYNTSLSQQTLKAVQAEAVRAYIKHKEMALFNPGLHWSSKLAALMEEVGEVAHELTYDSNSSRDDLIKELVQVASVALSWAESLKGSNNADS